MEMERNICRKEQGHQSIHSQNYVAPQEGVTELTRQGDNFFVRASGRQGGNL